ncbi:MAG TPA: nucleotide exchange factor GrpE [Deltaproteobacteria bacterium]|nr:nucleotide exchange factor GrpE [Deltaproteobacteria bacterium]HIJ41823.1 nucleotide exchange factor GrpE [Deltaproteobacteria bacterium]
MKEQKEFLRGKLVEFQLRIAELNHALKEQEDLFRNKEEGLYSGLFEVLDAFEGIEETLQAKEEDLNKTGKRLGKSIRAVHRKLVRLLKANDVVPMEFPDRMARIELCRIVDTQESGDLGNETILSVVKKGYLQQKEAKVLRKAEVITVLNR